jgi:hypothetical protein
MDGWMDGWMVGWGDGTHKIKKTILKGITAKKRVLKLNSFS